MVTESSNKNFTRNARVVLILAKSINGNHIKRLKKAEIVVTNEVKVFDKYQYRFLIKKV